ncbi:hypothetical protein B0A49_12439 [Cryomyces minteri]|uniref:Phosphotyrosine protein phosphatase I domain-containing protein n=1 Tax=Cryomyces minteri TaxID=331657 RepID=A0A4U0X1J4_9PEZI|nr:hypothetical protein B0A49_12439 [Cryomyces minteri]
MAEAIGLALGAVGLLSVFSTCLEAFDLIDLGRSHGRDVTLLEQKFDNQRLNEPEIKERINKNLSCIALLLGDEGRLKRKYGLRQASQNQALTTARESTRAFQDSFAEFMRNVAKRQQQTSSAKVAKWAIRDRAKFEKLVEDIKDFIDGLDECTRFLDIRSIQRSLVERDIAALPDEVRKRVEDASSEYGDLVSNAAAEIRAQRVLGWSEQVQANGSEITTSASSFENLAMDDPVISVLFVDFGNSCRSPMAEAVFRRLTEDIPQIGTIDSAGVGGVTHLMRTDSRTVTTLYRHGIDSTRRYPRQIMPADLANFTYILTMDRYNLRTVKKLKLDWEDATQANILLFGQFGNVGSEEVMDP